MTEFNLTATDEQVRRAAAAALIGGEQIFIDEYLKAYVASGELIVLHRKILEWVLAVYEEGTGESSEVLDAALNEILMTIVATAYLANDETLPKLSTIDGDMYIGFEMWSEEKMSERAQLGRAFTEQLSELLVRLLGMLLQNATELPRDAIYICADMLGYAFACEAQE